MFFYKDCFRIKLPTKADMTLNKETKQNQTLFLAFWPTRISLANGHSVWHHCSIWSLMATTKLSQLFKYNPALFFFQLRILTHSLDHIKHKFYLWPNKIKHYKMEVNVWCLIFWYYFPYFQGMFFEVCALVLRTFFSN